jgi:DNA-binding GntR family transcriptional regulator
MYPLLEDGMERGAVARTLPARGEPLSTAAAPADTAHLHAVHRQLRAAILSGSVPAGAIMNQVHLAREMGVSRTPVREALRMLQAEGLIDARHQHRMRVTAITPEEVDSVYAIWIQVQALAIAMTVPRLTADDMALIREALACMNESASSPHKEDWGVHHRSFHDHLLMHAGPALTTSIATCWERSERVRRAHGRSDWVWRISADEHVAIVDAYAERSVETAVLVSSRHLARTALTVIGHLEPDYEPRAIRAALGFMPPPRAAAAEPPLRGRKGRIA